MKNNHFISNVVSENTRGVAFLAFEQEVVKTPMSFRQFDIIHDRAFSYLNDSDIRWTLREEDTGNARDFRYSYFSFELLCKKEKQAQEEFKDIFSDVLVSKLTHLSRLHSPGFSGKRSCFVFIQEEDSSANELAAIKIGVLMSNNVFYSDYTAREGYWLEKRHKLETFAKEFSFLIEAELTYNPKYFKGPFLTCNVEVKVELKDE